MPRRRSTVPVNAETTGSRKPTNKVSNVESSDRSDPGFAGVAQKNGPRGRLGCGSWHEWHRAKTRASSMRRKNDEPLAPQRTPRRHPEPLPAPRPRTPGRAMTLWTFCQSVLLTFNAFAILNEQRFLEKCGLGQSALTSGYVSATSPRGQLIGLITATQYMRGASSRRPGRSRRRSRARPSVTGGGPRFLGTAPPTAPARRKEHIV